MNVEKESIEKQLQGIVNASGYPFQMAVERVIRTNRCDIPWQEPIREFHWNDPESNERGFADIVVDSPMITLIIECKRPRQADWVFLISKTEINETNQTKCRWSDVFPKRKSLGGWDDFLFDPLSYQSSFCIPRGGRDDAGSFLENICDGLLKATNGVATAWTSACMKKEMNIGKHHIFLPIIVTTASLHAVFLDPAEIDSKQGIVEMGKFDFKEIQSIRFRKSLGPISSLGNQSLLETNLFNQRTILIVNIGGLQNLLNRFSLGHPLEGYIWEAERQRERDTYQMKAL